MPYASHVHLITSILRDRYGSPDHYNYKDPLDDLLFVVCSVRTDERKYRASYKTLRDRYPLIEQLVEAPTSDIADCFREAGLAAQKAGIIKRILTRINNIFDEVTLSPLQQRSDQECEQFLTSLPGVGRKIARCVMMYALEREVFPVDTHCWRISRRLGWIRPTRPNKSCSPKDMDRLQNKIPPDLRYDLHVNMIAFGRDICTPLVPRCSICPLVARCRRVGVRK